MAMGTGKVVHPVAADTLRVRGDGGYTRPVGWILKLWRCGVAVAALVGVHRHWVVGCMAPDT